MEAMDVDRDSPSQQLALIRAVRTLDEDDSLSLPEKLEKLWRLLAAAKDTRLHAVEESILRWLLKQMGGNTDVAEHARRHPLTWTILGHVIPKIPTQALGRSLAHSRFVSILNKTLADVTRQEAQAGMPRTNEGTAETKKRKRGPGWPTTLAELRASTGCLNTASQVFEALAVLLEQGVAQSGDTTPKKRVGAEHIKSLFSSSSEETRDITAKLLLICDNSLSLTDVEFVKGQQSWIDTLTTVWNLRLHSKEDSLDFTRYIYERTCLTLAKLEHDRPSQVLNPIYKTCRDVWIPQLQTFLAACFIRPARQRFGQDKNIDMLKLAMQMAQTDVVASTTVMWRIAARTPRDISDPKSKIEHGAWTETIFQAVLAGLRSLTPRKKNEVLSELLDIALQTRSIPGTETLRQLYHQNALDGDDTDWTLLSKILACDADVFLGAQTPEAIFENVSSVSNSDTQKRNDVVSNVILPMQDAYCTARDLAGFVMQWFRSLCAAESVEQSIWFDMRIRQHLAAILQTSLSSSRVLRLLRELESIPSKAGELLVVLDGICAGLTDENMIADISPKMISMMSREWEGVCPNVLALKWRVLGYLASWETSDECKKLWKRVKSDIKPILKKEPLSTAETLEAFSCCYKLSLSNHIGGKYEEDLAKLICTVLGRLVSSIKTEADLQSLKPYIALAFSHLPRLSEEPKQEVNTLTDEVVKLFWLLSSQLPSLSNEQRLEYVRPLIHNYDVVDEEPMVDALIAPFLEALDNSETQCGWTQPHSFGLLSILLEFPVESWTRGRRKRIMASWKKQKHEINCFAARDSKYAVVILRLLIMIMQQPTFYENMEFIDLVDIYSSITRGDTTLLSLAERFADNTIRQVLTNTNEFTQAYLLNASQYFTDRKPENSSVACTQTLLLKSLAARLCDHKSAGGSLQCLEVDQDIFGRKLANTVERALADFASEGNGASIAKPLTTEKLRLLSVILDAARIISIDATSQLKIELPGDVLTGLEKIGNVIMLEDPATVWKLKSFLVRQSPDRYTQESFTAALMEGIDGFEEQVLYGFVDAYAQGKSRSTRAQLLGELMACDKFTEGSIGPLLAAQRLLELYEGSTASGNSADSTQGDLDLAKVYQQFTSHLKLAKSLPHFKRISETMLFLLDKHATAVTQHNIESTLTSIVEVCTAHGPAIVEPKAAAGEIFAAVCRLLALIIKRHRRRLSGHFHLLLRALRALLTVLLTDPSPISRRAVPRSRAPPPPWLLAPLQPRHGERFARLLTLVCEPSAASVASKRSRGPRSELGQQQPLDSATDAAKREAGRHMYLILEAYVALQLEGAVSRDMRKALEVGVFAVLDITAEGGRRVVNESLDAAGRAVFRALFAEYRKFGKWKGV